MVQWRQAPSSLVLVSGTLSRSNVKHRKGLAQISHTPPTMCHIAVLCVCGSIRLTFDSLDCAHVSVCRVCSVADTAGTRHSVHTNNVTKRTMPAVGITPPLQRYCESESSASSDHSAV